MSRARGSHDRRRNDPDVSTAAPIPPLQTQDVLSAQQVRSNPQSASPTAIASVQRHAGNQAVLLSIQRNPPTTPTPTPVRKKRAKGKMVDPLELTGGLSEQKGGIFGTTGTALDQNTWKTQGNVEAWNAPKDPKAPVAPDPKASDPNQALGFTGGSFAALQGVSGTVFASISTHANRVEYNKTKDDPDSKARAALALRGLKMSGTDIGKNVVGTGAAVTDLTAKGLAITQAGSQAAATAGAAGGFFAAPLALFSALRDSRKAYKAWVRCRDLEAEFNNWDAPRYELTKAKEQFEEAENARKGAEESWEKSKDDKARIEGEIPQVQAAITTINTQLTALRAPKGPSQGFAGKLKGAGTWIADKAKIAKLEIELSMKTRELASKQQELQESIAAMQASKDAAEAAATEKGKAFDRYENGRQAFEDMQRIVGSTGEKAKAAELGKAKGSGSSIGRVGKGTDRPSLLEIQAYALNKNKGGLIKKVMSAAGGFLATGGAAAAFAVSLAAAGMVGSVALAATPVGWALAGAAAAIGLGLAGYKAIKWLKKRWEQAATDADGNVRTTGQRLGATLAVWKATGRSRRDKYGQSLLDMALGDKVFKEQQERAIAIIKSLGIDWDGLGFKPPLLKDAKPMPQRDVTKNTPTMGQAGASGASSGPEQLTQTDLDDTKQAEQNTEENAELERLRQAEKASKASGGTHVPNKALANYKAARDLIATKMGS